MNIFNKKRLAALLLAACFSSELLAQHVIQLKPDGKDATIALREALTKVQDDDLKIVLSKGQYTFFPSYAFNQYSTITNHGNGIKNIAFLMEGFKSVEIEGNGAELIFHGQMAPFQFINNDKVTVKNLTIDWDIPFTFLGEVVAVNEKEAWRDIKPFSGSHNWVLKNGQVLFPNVDGFNYSELGSTLAFDGKHKRVAHGALDLHSNPKWVEQRPNNILRFHEKLRQFPKVGQLLSSKGDREHDRYAPAFQVKNSKNITFDQVIVHHALGMGFLFERSENIKILNSGVYLKPDSQRVISSTADATHFANCKGDILIENSRFENMLDDGTNVHGTYTVVDKVIDKHTILVELKHFEQLGFEFAGVGDDIWFIHHPSMQRASVNTVNSVKVINERFIELSFENALPSQLDKGDLLENKTWNPTFTMRGNTIKNHRARNIVLKTPLKTVIENNHLSSMMSSIFFRGESFFWFESGEVNDVLIRNNEFEYCAYSGMQHAVLNITPRFGKTFKQDELYDRNIRFENNTIKTFDNRIVWADRVDGLTIKNNTIIKLIESDKPQLYPNAPIIELSKSQNVVIENNDYQGEVIRAIKVDQQSLATLKNDNSIK